MLAVGNFLCMMRQDTTVTTAMQDIQMPGPMKTEPELVWMAVMIRGVCGEGGRVGSRSGERCYIHVSTSLSACAAAAAAAILQQS